MLIHDLVKIRLTDAGYLMNYPYHMISDKEMCDAFIGDGGYFYDTYPLLDPSLESAYTNLVKSIKYHIGVMLAAPEDSRALPSWVYSYMLGSTISVHSLSLDIHDLILPLGVDNTDDIFDGRASVACFHESEKWIRKTMIKETVELDGDIIDLRPPTMFGEPHVIKSIRLSQASPV